MGIPNNIIIMWSGAIIDIPNGWLLCDGTNDTPDLRNRFVVGAGSKYSSSEVGGSADAINVSHNHTATASTTTNHTHTISGVDELNSTHFPSNRANPGSTPVRSTNTNAGTSAHTHTSNSNLEGQSGTNKNLPPYLALAFIMFGGE